MPAVTPDFSKSSGLITAIAQDAATGEVLMVGHMNAEAWSETLATGNAVYFSRSKNRLWRKGEESGHVQTVEEIRIDCDADAVLLSVRQQGAACHEGYSTCFFRRITASGVEIVRNRVFDPEKVYGKQKTS